LISFTILGKMLSNY